MASTISKKKGAVVKKKKRYYVLKGWFRHITGINVSRQKYMEVSISQVTTIINIKTSGIVSSGMELRSKSNVCKLVTLVWQVIVEKLLLRSELFQSEHTLEFIGSVQEWQ